MGFSEIRQLNFGHVAAESELAGLEKYFISTQTYINAKSETQRKTYYIGQRGAGKSALFTKLADDYNKSRNGNDMTLKITPDDFSYERFNDVEHNYADIKAVYGHVWHYTLLTHIFRRIVEFYDERPNFKTNKYNIEKLRSYLEKKNVVENPSFLSTFLTYFGEFTENKQYNKALKTGGSKNHKMNMQMLALPEISEEMNAFQKITDSHHIYLFIDELDTGWDNSKGATSFIHGLFYAIRQIKKMQNVRVFVSLRSDMYNNLSSILPDPEKMREEIERFSWNPGKLKGLIAERIKASYPGMSRSTTSDIEAISSVFDAGVLEYIIQHTLQRPREVIQFCKDAHTMFTEQRDYLTYDKISLNTVKEIEPEFSKNKFEDICSEYEYQYPNISFFLSLFSGCKECYAIEEFKLKLEEVMCKSLDELGEDSWIGRNFSTKQMIKILFEIGFIKLYKNGKYLAYYEGSFINVEIAPKVKIHDVFVSYLSYDLECE